ncbi:cysteine hydrolase [Chitinimonas arctica]|uniref:Cysteine hydrolase n=1 Tax=Chitinimonas arctica TaxID=2594795 RepID=A0A516SCF4_9NEIS|nr:cysteine hydrolase family protein [Chitinimonas arctica]QDQ25831.1 cysteine hydrolase [Chitinimonas arctica]
MKTALIIIDVQQGLFDPSPRPYEADAVIQRINALSEQARAAHIAVAFVQHQRPNGPLAFQSPGWELAKQLVVQDGDKIIAKTTPDSFLNTELSAWLTEQAVGRLVICGYATEFCVDTSTRRAAALGYEIVLAADAHTTHDKQHADAQLIRAHHNATLPNMTSFGVKITALASEKIDFRVFA